MADNERSPHNAHDVDPLKLCIRSGVLHGEVKHRILNVGSGCRIAKGDTLEEIHPRRTVPVCACRVLKPRSVERALSRVSAGLAGLCKIRRKGRNATSTVEVLVC